MPITNLQSASNRADCMRAFNNQGFNYLLNNSWMKLPVAITNHNLVKIDNRFLGDVENISNYNQTRKIVYNYYTLLLSVINICQESSTY